MQIFLDGGFLMVFLFVLTTSCENTLTILCILRRLKMPFPETFNYFTLRHHTIIPEYSHTATKISCFTTDLVYSICSYCDYAYITHFSGNISPQELKNIYVVTKDKYFSIRSYQPAGREKAHFGIVRYSNKVYKLTIAR